MNARTVLSGATGAFQICIAFVIGFVKVEPGEMLSLRVPPQDGVFLLGRAHFQVLCRKALFCSDCTL